MVSGCEFLSDDQKEGTSGFPFFTGEILEKGRLARRMEPDSIYCSMKIIDPCRLEK
jgi:hypothetical protein